MPSHFQVVEETQEMAGHPIAGVPGLEPDADVVVVRDVEHQSALPALEADGSQADETKQLRDGDDGGLVGRA
eukprot:13457716-Heterocapsa_arctica.AAC.1